MIPISLENPQSFPPFEACGAQGPSHTVPLKSRILPPCLLGMMRSTEEDLLHFSHHKFEGEWRLLKMPQIYYLKKLEFQDQGQPWIPAEGAIEQFDSLISALQIETLSSD